MTPYENGRADMKKEMIESLPLEAETVCFCGELKDKLDAHGYCSCGAFIPNRRGFSDKESGLLKGWNAALKAVREVIETNK